MLDTHGEFYPFAHAIDLNGETHAINVYEGDEVPLSSDLHQSLPTILIERRTDIRAAVLAADVRLPELDTDAIRVDAEHSEGIALRAMLPYTSLGPDQAIEYGEMWARLALDKFGVCGIRRRSS